MDPIKMVDLAGQYQRIREEVDKGIAEVLNSTAFINGPEVSAFEKELADYLDARDVVGCANGTDALQIALMALGLEEGDEVIVPDFTFVATIEVVALLGLRPVIVDVDPNTFCMDPDRVKEALSARSRVLLPVHLFGQCANMEELMRIARENGLYVIEDSAQALGAQYCFENGARKMAGTIGHIGCTSFFPSKNLGAFGDGGAMITNDEELGKLVRSIASHGKGDHKYYNERVGVNSRLDTLQAAILRVKLQYLDTFGRERQMVADLYDECLKDLKGVQIPVRDPASSHVFHQYTIQVSGGLDRNALKTQLSSGGIPSAVYYPVPMHAQKPYSGARMVEGDPPVSTTLCEKVLSLPMHTELQKDQVERIGEVISTFVEAH